MKKGFTLIELSIVLIIIGLLTGGAFQVLKMMNEKARAIEAKETLQAAKQAIITFAINNNNQLPDQAEFTAMNLKGAGDIAMYYNSDTALQTNVCSVVSTPLQTKNSNDVTTPNIGFVLAVAGENFNVQTGRIGDLITFHPWNTPNIDDETTVLNRPEPYDDLYTQVTLGELQATVDCQSKKFQIINTILPRGTAGVTYTINPTVVTTGGTSPYSYTISGNPAGSSLTGNTFTWATPTQGNYQFSVTATDANGATDDGVLLLTIDSSGGSGGGGGSGTVTRQECLDACAAAGGSRGEIKRCERSCPRR